MPFLFRLASQISLLQGAVVLTFVFGLIYALQHLFLSRHPHFPPGPKPLPFIGNAHQMPVDGRKETFKQWGEKYGDVIHLRIFGQSMIILNSVQACQDLLDKRGSIYSDRPRFVLFSDLMGWKSASTHVRYGPRFRKHRRFVNQLFNVKAFANLKPLQDEQNMVLLNGMLEAPDSFLKHCKRYAAGTILKITYGYDTHSVDDLFIKLADRAASLTVEYGTPGAALVDVFPFLQHIPTWAPYSSFKQNASIVKKAVDDMMDIPYNIVKADMLEGSAPDSYALDLLKAHIRPEDGSILPEDEEDIKGSAGTLLAAGEDTTVAVMHTFILAMVLYPHVLLQLQEEMDRVTKKERLPTDEDQPDLPYLNAVLKEVIRWSPPVPFGIPHRLMEDDYYREFFIPSGATVLANIHEALQDCADPHLFLPERYMEKNDLPDPWTLVFGFGRRVCPGRHFAVSSLWFFTAGLVASFDISKALDNQGNEVTPPLDFLEGFVRHPKHFKCSITPRSEKITNIILNSKL